jgi:hypothetical protein
MLFTPQAEAILPPGSLRSVNGSLWCALKSAWDFASSREMPMTSAPAPTKSSYWSRNAHASFVQPYV